ncbi:MAG: hypothetical protein BGO49_20375 [Planctomycetales bacterium 71-10]|nr:MAG: hypothetical protein BGO49_20375 [Planctomycetales bacterium 71-10]
MTFKEWLEEAGWIDDPVLKGMLALHRLVVEFFEANGGPITLEPSQRDFPLRFPGRHLDKALPAPQADGPRIIRGPDQNYLVPLDSLERIQGMNAQDVPKMLSHFVRDQPYIAAFAQASPENMASAIIFVLLTIRADFMQVMQTFPLLMSVLMTHFKDRPMAPGELEAKLTEMMARQAAGSHPNLRVTSKAGKVYRQGYGVGGQIFGFKYDGVTDVWNRREAIYGSVTNLVAKKDTIAVFEYLLANVKGLAQAKAGFCVQLIFGEMGCIDMHNVNLYSQYYLDRGQPRSKNNVFQPDHLNGLYMRSPTSKRDLDLYNALDPRKFSTKPGLPGPRPSGVVDARQMRTWGNRTERFKGSVKAYMDVLKALEKDGFNTIKLWDVWVSYVANNYVKSSPKKDVGGDEDGGSRYARDGLLAGNPLDPANDPTDARIMRTKGPIPDRNTLLTQSRSIRWVTDPQAGVMKPIKKDNDESNPLDTFSVDGMDKEPSAGAASLAHGATWWWRTPGYWWDLIRQAQGHRAKDGIRYSSDDWAGPISDVAKPLAYLATEPEMLDNLFPDRDERRRFKRELDDVLKRHEFWKKKDYKPSKASKVK